MKSRQAKMQASRKWQPGGDTRNFSSLNERPRYHVETMLPPSKFLSSWPIRIQAVPRRAMKPARRPRSYPRAKRAWKPFLPHCFWRKKISLPRPYWFAIPDLAFAWRWRATEPSCCPARSAISKNQRRSARRRGRSAEKLSARDACRVPFSQRLDLSRGRPGGNKTTLRGKKSRIAHWRAVGGLHVAFCELREINLIEDRKCGEFGNGVRVCDGRFWEQE